MSSLRFLLNVFDQKSFTKIIFKEFILSLIFAIIYTIFCDDQDDFNGKRYHGLTCNNLFENFYFSTVTLFGVGYGDLYPKSQKTRLVCLINMFFVMYFIMIFFPGKYPVSK